MLLANFFIQGTHACSVCVTSARNGCRISRTTCETKKVKGKRLVIITGRTLTNGGHICGRTLLLAINPSKQKASSRIPAIGRTPRQKGSPPIPAIGRTLTREGQLHGCLPVLVTGETLVAAAHITNLKAAQAKLKTPLNLLNSLLQARQNTLHVLSASLLVKLCAFTASSPHQSVLP